MSERDNNLLLKDMLEAGAKIRRYIIGMEFNDFMNDEKTIDAVVRNLQVMGEAANQMNREFQLAHSDVKWNQIRGFRNRIVHEYFGIDFEIVWDVITNDLEEIMTWLEKTTSSK
jgi:uncharacterized protein with HEPN domain